MNFYNEHDPKAAAWLRELMRHGLIPQGIVDERSISEIKPYELEGYTQCHFFAGIGGWSRALQLAGWPANRPVWTGSCPCQPFSVAGKGLGVDDERHLWPVFARLIEQCQPAIVFGEQVASKAGRCWLAGVFADLEGMGYSRAAADLCAAGIGAPHIRQRLYWVAHSQHAEWGAKHQINREASRGYGLGRSCDDGGLANNNNKGLEEWQEQPARGQRTAIVRSGDAGGLGDTGCPSDERRGESGDMGCAASEEQGKARQRQRGGDAFSNPVQNHFWSDSRPIHCRDGKTRRVPTEPAFFPLAHGVPARVVRLRGYGNAIVPQVAAEFIQAAEEAIALEGL